MKVNLKKIVGRGVTGLFLVWLDKKQVGVTFDLHVQIRGKKHLVWILPQFSYEGVPLVFHGKLFASCYFNVLQISYGTGLVGEIVS